VIVLFDGVCNLCNAFVTFLIDRDRGDALRFASLQSPFARDLLQRLGRAVPSGDPDSVVVVDGTEVRERSDAALHIVRHLPAPWRWLGALRVVPRPLRDAVYRFVARHRYAVFGRTAQCRVPTPELRRRFLDAEG
jgi:predicted DCC family thiol-disulfide oxidoreductase YuxK